MVWNMTRIIYFKFKSKFDLLIILNDMTYEAFVIILRLIVMFYAVFILFFYAKMSIVKIIESFG